MIIWSHTEGLRYKNSWQWTESSTILGVNHVLTALAVSLSRSLCSYRAACSGFPSVRSRVSFSSWQSWTLLCLLPPLGRVELLPGKECAILPEQLGRSAVLHLRVWSPGLAASTLPGQLKMSSLQWPSLPTPSPNLSVQGLLEPLHSPGLAFFRDGWVAAGILEGPLPGQTLPLSSQDALTCFSTSFQTNTPKTICQRQVTWEISFKFFHVQNVLIPSLHVMFGVGIREMFKVIHLQSFEGIAVLSSALKLVIHNGVPLKVVDLVIFF